MDSNGLSDPYVKLHLLPGANKVVKIHVVCLENIFLHACIQLFKFKTKVLLCLLLQN